jgi:cytochrome c553
MISRTTLWLVVALTVALARAESALPPGIVVRYCSGCHEASGNSELPYVPKLAGLNESYLRERIKTFLDAGRPAVDELATVHIRQRKDGAARVLMVGMTHVVSTEELQVAARWYANQLSPHAVVRDPEPFVTGKNLYLNGAPSRSVPACQTCHGPDARGSATAPSLAGQHAAYVEAQLRLFRENSRSNPSMSEVARKLGEVDVRAVSGFVQSLGSKH